MYLLTKISQNDNKQIEHFETEDEGEAMAKKMIWERENYIVKVEEYGKIIYETGK